MASRLRFGSALTLVLVAVGFGCDPNPEDSSNPLPVPTGGGITDGGGGTGATGGAPQGGDGGNGATTSQGGNPDGGSGGEGGVGGMVEGGGGSGEGACDSGGPVLEDDNAHDAFLLKGTMLLPAGPTNGELLIDGNMITCIAADCSTQAAAANATIIDTHGIISPGLIDAHNHILFDIMDEDDWVPPKIYSNHNQWTTGPDAERYGAMVDAKQYLAGEAGSPVKIACEMDKYGEAKALVSGTTSVLAAMGTLDRSCHQSVARTIDTRWNGLPDDKMQVASLGVPQSGNSVCANFDDGDTTAYVIHVAEGVDATARGEFEDLYECTSAPEEPGCLYDERTALVHATALNDAQLEIVGNNNMSIVWSPRSNVFLYGGGTDTSKTTNIPQALIEDINVALGPDWSMGGSQNMLDEMRYADFVDGEEWGDILSPRDVFEMATINSAKALGVEQYIGTLEVGKRADVAVFLPVSGADDYDVVLGATPREVTLVFVDGALLYGDVDFQPLTASNAVCQEVDICCRQKFLCLGFTGGAAADRLDQTLDEVITIINDELQSYDDQNLTPYNFFPVTPLVKCP